MPATPSLFGNLDVDPEPKSAGKKQATQVQAVQTTNQVESQSAPRAEKREIQPGDIVKLKDRQVIVTGMQFPAGKQFRVTSIPWTSHGRRANLESTTDGAGISHIPLERLELVEAATAKESSPVVAESLTSGTTIETGISGGLDDFFDLNNEEAGNVEPQQQSAAEAVLPDWI